MNGIPFLLNGATLLFVALKLTNYIDWSWWLVLAPTGVPMVIYLVCWLLVTAIEARRRSRMTPSERAREDAARLCDLLAAKIGGRK